MCHFTDKIKDVARSVGKLKLYRQHELNVVLNVTDLSLIVINHNCVFPAVESQNGCHEKGLQEKKL